MRRKRKRESEKGRSSSSAATSPAWTNHPFRDLKRLLPPAPPPPVRGEPVVKTAAAAPSAVIREADLFERAMAGARPLAAQERQRVERPPPASPPRQVLDADAEALAMLCDLVSGEAPFDISDSDEHVEGAIVGLDPRLLRRLRNGELAYQAYLDLHRLTTEEARPAVESFLTQSLRSGKRCVLIIHGRGRNSKDQIPILKPKLTQWLTRGMWARWVLAFASARPCDGGVGALYVLLRRQRQDRPGMRVTNGAKW